MIRLVLIAFYFVIGWIWHLILIGQEFSMVHLSSWFVLFFWPVILLVVVTAVGVALMISIRIQEWVYDRTIRLFR